QLAQFHSAPDTDSKRNPLARRLPNRESLHSTAGVIRTHVATRTGGFHRRFKILVDLRILVLEFDLPAALLHTGVGAAFAVLHAHEAELPTAPAQRQIARRLGAGIQMLVEPLIRRHNDAAGFPIDSLHRLPIRPENRVALAAQYNDVRAGSVLMPFLVSTNGELRDMCAYGLLGKIELH